MPASRAIRFVTVTSLFSFSAALVAQSAPPGLVVETMPAEQRAKIDAAAEKVLATTGVPSATLAVVEHGEIVYTHAYGDARLDPKLIATPEMRYSVGSISKQFTAAAILLLEQQGKLSIDDKVSKYLPDLTRANDVTIRMLLSHTSGYQDYWPEDYLMPPMREAVTAQHILDVWGKKPLDFEPGTKWQYSNTNFVIAGRIVEMVSGEDLMEFLQKNVFKPLDMEAVWNSDAKKLGDTDAEGYIRYALGPLRPAPKEGRGWMFAAGELAMPAYDLAQWNISMMNRSLLARKSYDEMADSVKLKDGTDSHYGLGIFVRQFNGHVLWEHSGEVSGFTAENMVFPDDKLAIDVLTNQDAASAGSGIAIAVSDLLLGSGSHEAHPNAALDQAKMIFAGLQQGKIDRSLFTENCNAYFGDQALADFKSSLGPLGTPSEFTEGHESLRGGMTFHSFIVKFADRAQTLHVTTYTMPDGKLEQYLVIPAE
ncbi:serine hydrolase domain-containing protein [Silvibacterium sp.]|uniref:serine hydrolase domain-containing protein n=1 Tax=Silvibacterium sp. TaxID=1964179 RepID=UPI0039E35DF6